jgi:hypothetical protein
MAEALGGVNIRSVRRWSSGQQIPPAGVWRLLLEMLANHRGECAAVETEVERLLRGSEDEGVLQR